MFLDPLAPRTASRGLRASADGHAPAEAEQGGGVPHPGERDADPHQHRAAGDGGRQRAAARADVPVRRRQDVACAAAGGVRGSV
jgi:hypothetical protein